MDSEKRNKANLRSYNLIARQYAGDSPGEDDPVMRKDCRDLFVRSLKGKRILEIGCGPGMDASFMHEAGLDVVATDFSEEFVQIVRERYPNITAHQMDMTKPDLPTGSFDGLYAFASFLHLPRSEGQNILTGFQKLLNNSGVLFLSLIQSSMVDDYIIENWGGQEGNSVLFTCYKPEEIEKLLKSVGFKKVEVHYVKSELYEKLPRLVERGVTNYQVLASNDH